MNEPPSEEAARPPHEGHEGTPSAKAPAGKLVELTVGNKPVFENSRKVVVKPIETESSLYYYNWVQENIKRVSEATDGRVGYIHIPDMQVAGMQRLLT